MSDYPKIECTCIKAYKSRKMRDPNCCACSCDYNDVVDENQQLKQSIEKLERERDAILQEAKVNECELNTQKGIIQGVRDVFDLRVYDFNLIPALKMALAQRYIEQQEKGVDAAIDAGIELEYIENHIKPCGDIKRRAIEQLRKGGEE